MKRIHFVKLLFVAVLVSGSLNAWGADVTYEFSKATNNPGNAQDWTSDNIDISTKWEATKGGQNTPKYYSTGTGLRVYNGGKFTISSTKVISSITLTFSGTGYTFSSSNKTNPQTVEPNANSYSWEVSQTCRLQKIDITYSSSSTETTPSITQHPEDATYDQGAKAAALTITASGNPTPTYQWYSNTSNKNSNGTVISGETKDSYTPSTASTGIFYYYCVATNSQGSASSNVATITVNTVINYTVRWSLGGDEYAEGNPTTSVKSGERVTTLPTPPDGNAIGSCANTFMGWSTHDLGTKKGQSAPTDLFTTAESSPVITQDTIFYAVFATDPTK